MVVLGQLAPNMSILVLPLPIIIFFICGTLVSSWIALFTTYVFASAIIKGTLEGYKEKVSLNNQKNIE